MRAAEEANHSARLLQWTSLVNYFQLLSVTLDELSSVYYSQWTTLDELLSATLLEHSSTGEFSQIHFKNLFLSSLFVDFCRRFSKRNNAFAVKSRRFAVFSTLLPSGRQVGSSLLISLRIFRCSRAHSFCFAMPPRRFRLDRSLTSFLSFCDYQRIAWGGIRRHKEA